MRPRHAARYPGAWGGAASNDRLHTLTGGRAAPANAQSDPMDSQDHRPRVAAERRERMRSRLLSSALQLVAAQGPSSTSIDDVIAAAEVSRGTFYKYFPSPEALVQELAFEVAKDLVYMADPVGRGH